ncbi:MAG: FTR1 family iron permease, partial [Candidatus Binatia bacterium]
FFLFEDSALDRNLAIRDPSLYGTIESEWAGVISDMRRGAPADVVRRRGERVLALLGQAKEATAAAGSVFADSLLIILREGFEAILIVSALASWLRRVGHAAKVPYLYGGAGLAVAASVGLWVAARTVLEVSGVAREALEGWTMLLAAVVLFWVSYWLVSKAEAERWQAFVRSRAERALGRGALLGFGFLSFVVVFREGFETVLFYEALSARASGASGQSLLLGGFATGLALLSAFYVLFLRIGPRIPMRPFFAVTGALLYLMAFKFAGAGVFELQVAQVLSQTPIARFPDSLALREWLGVYPYAESLALQGLLLVLAGVAAALMLRGRRRVEREEPIGEAQRRAVG